MCVPLGRTRNRLACYAGLCWWREASLVACVVVCTLPLHMSGQTSWLRVWTGNLPACLVVSVSAFVPVLCINLSACPSIYSINMPAYLSIRLHIYIYMCVCVCMYVYVYRHVYVYMYIHISIYTPSIHAPIFLLRVRALSCRWVWPCGFILIFLLFADCHFATMRIHVIHGNNQVISAVVA